MKLIAVFLAVPIVTLGAVPRAALAQTAHEFNIQAFTKNLEKRYESCPIRTVVASFKHKRHRLVWEKQGWGPPKNVFVDAKRNDSLLYPYLVTVRFYLPITYGREHKTKAGAEADSKLYPLNIPLAGAQGDWYRTIYAVSKNAVRIKSAEFRESQIGGASPKWVERTLWPNACWDQLKWGQK